GVGGPGARAVAGGTDRGHRAGAGLRWRRQRDAAGGRLLALWFALVKQDGGNHGLAPRIAV
ncbi:MAG TPA: hypothetical protein VH478_11090, partial [Trebonia sp.]|nr:hypothetical protein [Trebonia sp.]